MIDSIDHFVLTVKDVGLSAKFYSQTLGMEVVTFGAGRTALRFGNQKINLHKAGEELAPHASKPTPGSGDFCLITSVPLEEVVEHLESCGVKITEGPCCRTGAAGAIRSIYFRDPDENLVEVSNYE